MIAPIRLSPECRLVFLSAGAGRNDAAIGTLARGPLNWPRMVLVAEREHAASSVWRALERMGHGAMPASPAAHLRKNAMVSDFRMLHLAQRLQDTLRAMRAHGVPCMLLKGAALGASRYASFVDRPMADVDILIRPEHVPAARLAILEAGWGERQDPALTELLADHHHLVPYFDAAGTGLRIELHTSMLSSDHPFGFSEDDVWAAARPAPAPYEGALIPAARHLLFHACVHFAWSHTMQFGAWRTFRDIEAIVSEDFDWSAFVDFAHESHSATACYWTLRLANRLGGIPISEAVLERLHAPSSEVVCRALERHFVSYIAPGEAPTCPSVRLEHLLWRAAMRPKWSGHRLAPHATAKNWELVLHGTAPDRAGSRALRHLTHMRDWWNYFLRTLAPLT